MKLELTNDPVAVARIATDEEIRAAIAPFSDAEYVEVLCEIAADMGGYIRISDVDRETSRLVEELTTERETWIN